MRVSTRVRRGLRHELAEDLGLLTILNRCT
jgi:hypothetical protein